MFIKKFKLKRKGKVYEYIHLVKSVRVGKNVNNKYIANLTNLPKNVIEAIERELKRKTNINTEKQFSLLDLKFKQGKKCGGLIVIKHLLKELHIFDALGNNQKNVGYSVFQIMGRILNQGSRNFIANEWNKTQAIAEVLNLPEFGEDVLYQNLDWLAENQEKIEQKLFRLANHSKPIKNVFLYDITSSYLEGTKNELANFGYNRDKKSGKMQIVIGLMTDENGYPISVQVFEGNTTDNKTVVEQLKKLKNKFGIEHVVFVGDKGMIKSQQITYLNEKNWHYITTITKPQIEKLITQNVFQRELFCDELVEVEHENIRYVLHKNNFRSAEIKNNRALRILKIQGFVTKANEYLAEHKKASAELVLKKIKQKIIRFQLQTVLSVELKERQIELKKDVTKLEELSFLDGCYAVKSNIPKADATAEKLHKRYKDLAQVEQAFRTLKQSFLEIRPIFVRKDKRTRGHVFVCMLAYYVIKNVFEKCKDLGFTQEFIFKCLDDIQYYVYAIKKNIDVKIIPNELLAETQQILDALKIKLPTQL